MIVEVLTPACAVEFSDNSHPSYASVAVNARKLSPLLHEPTTARTKLRIRLVPVHRIFHQASSSLPEEQRNLWRLAVLPQSTTFRPLESLSRT